MTQREFVQAFAIRHNLADVEDMYALAAKIDELDPDQPVIQPREDILTDGYSKDGFAFQWPGTADQWGVSPDGYMVAIPAKYHFLAENKRLSSSEKSGILFEDSGVKHYFMFTGNVLRDGRATYRTPNTTHGDLKVLYSSKTPYPHFFARNFTFAPGSVYTPRFKTVDHRGRTVHEGEAV